MCFVFVCDKEERVLGRHTASGVCPYCGGMVQAVDVESQWRFCFLPLCFKTKRKYYCSLCSRRLEIDVMMMSAWHEDTPVDTAVRTLKEEGMNAIKLEEGSWWVLVYHDLLGMLQHPHHAKVTPKFCKQYARVGDEINKALLEYKEDVANGSFPDAQHNPYKISKADADVFSNELQRLGLENAASEAVQKMDTTKSIADRNHKK
ncbi:hypothetical protein VNO78_30551 [Psophocarpus tetragonolobus]|uniref:3-methyl-2-oxobutanoate hydroxymethyltransferase n=1 Tax=Psophocarpus tetragonolobus TaxID=3891 RepID=A0AAN9RWS2_PSOTE